MEITGYNVKRDDFEPEYDNDAEFPLAELEIRVEDSEADKATKREMLRLMRSRTTFGIIPGGSEDVMVDAAARLALKGRL